MGRKATIELVGPASYTEPGRPTFQRGQPQVVTDESVIDWAESVGWLKVTVHEQGPEPEPKVAEPVTPAKPKPAPKRRPKRAAKKNS